MFDTYITRDEIRYLSKTCVICGRDIACEEEEQEDRPLRARVTCGRKCLSDFRKRREASIAHFVLVEDSNIL